MVCCLHRANIYNLYTATTSQTKWQTSHTLEAVLAPRLFFKILSRSRQFTLLAYFFHFTDNFSIFFSTPFTSSHPVHSSIFLVNKLLCCFHSYAAPNVDSRQLLRVATLYLLLSAFTRHFCINSTHCGTGKH